MNPGLNETMIRRSQVIALALAGVFFSYGASAQAEERSEPGFKQRSDSYFREQAGQPLKRAAKQPPLAKGRGNYTRAYSFSIVAFAARCFCLNEMLDEANAALVENARHYLDNPKDIIDRDSFHWHADIVMRLIDMYGPDGSAHPGRLTAETVAVCLEPISIYVKTSSKHNRPDHGETKTWEFHSTENHHAMDFTVQWHFSKLAKDRPEYKDMKLADGSTLAEYYGAWNDYIVTYCRERAKKGPCIEIMCVGYNSVLLKGLYNFRDFGEPEVRRAAGMFLDLYWAYWAQEQLNGVDGGGKTRIRGVKGFNHGAHGIAALGWFYFGIGEKPSSINAEINALLSDYEPPEVVAKIAHGSRDEDPYEVRQRAQGLGEQGVGEAVMSDSMKQNKFRTDGGGIVRYTYCDPSFTTGTLMTEARPLEDWVAISAQNRWQGVVFADNPKARIVPVVRPAGNKRDVMNGQWSVQSKGSLITQKLKGNKAGGDMIVWMPEEGIGTPVREGDLVFVETEGAYAVIRVVGSKFKLTNKEVSNPSIEGSVRTAPPGYVVIPDDDFAPVILEVISKKAAKDYETFKSLAQARKPAVKDGVVDYESLYGDRLTFDSKQKNVPTINGQPVDYKPAKVLDSPFLVSDYDSGVVVIRKGEETKILDFR